MTELGPFPARQLGVTLPHEHLVIDLAPAIGVTDQQIMDLSLVVAEARLFRQEVGRSLVELTSRGTGGDPKALRKIAEETALYILGSGR